MPEKIASATTGRSVKIFIVLLIIVIGLIIAGLRVLNQIDTVKVPTLTNLQNSGGLQTADGGFEFKRMGSLTATFEYPEDYIGTEITIEFQAKAIPNRVGTFTRKYVYIIPPDLNLEALKQDSALQAAMYEVTQWIENDNVAGKQMVKQFSGTEILSDMASMERMASSGTSSRGSKYYNFTNEGNRYSIYETVNITNPWPSVLVQSDGQNIAEIKVETEDYQTYRFNKIVSGTQESYNLTLMYAYIPPELEPKTLTIKEIRLV
jgi:hypothetical protein